MAFPVQFTFSGGEISDEFRARADSNRYYLSLELCENFVTKALGGIYRRYGTELVEALPTKPNRLELFEFSIEQAYMLAYGEETVRVYQDRALLTSGIVTPYQAADLFRIHAVQSADVQFHAHPLYPPAIFARLSATTFLYQAVVFIPQPFFEADTFFTESLTLSATTGEGVTFTASGIVPFTPADVDRQLVAGLGRAVITEFTSPTVLVGDVLQTFSTVGPIAAGSWALTGSPAASIAADKTGPVGAKVRVTLRRPDADAPNLISDGDFSGGQGGWDDFSGALLESGTATAGTAPGDLFDTTALFITNGVQSNHIVINLDEGAARSNVVGIISETNVTHDGTDNFGVNDDYEIRDSGIATFTGGEATLTGGANGIAHIQRVVATEVGVVYQIKRDIREASLSMQVGSTSQASDLLAEFTSNIGNAITDDFIATTTTSFVQFRNNQDTSGVVDNVEVKNLSVFGFRAEDAGKYIAMHGGIIEITTLPFFDRADGIIWSLLDEDTENVSVVAGRWILGVPAWSTERGYPNTLTFHGGGLFYLGTRSQPLTVWRSVKGLFDNFSLGVEDDSGLDIEISGNNAIQWAESFQQLLISTRGDGLTLVGGQNGLTPTNNRQIPQGIEGSAPLRPLRSGTRLFHLSRDSRAIWELHVDEEALLFDDPILITLIAVHMTKSGIVDWALQTHPEKILWAVRADGVLVGYSFEFKEEVRGWHRHPMTGFVRSVAVLPVDNSTTEETEEVWLIVERNNVECIEVMRPRDEHDNVRKAALTVDSAVRYDFATAQTVFTGLGHLEGLTVQLVAREEVSKTNRRGEVELVDRLINVGTQVVQGGQVTSPDPHKRMDIGLPFTPRARTLPPEMQRQDGTLLSRKGRWEEVAIETFETIGLTISGVRIETQEVDDLLDTYVPPTSAILRGEGIGWEESPQVTFEQTLPFPATLLNFVGSLEVEEV